jgi:hypothetical protein
VHENDGVSQRPPLHFNLISVFRKAFEVFFGQLARGRSFAGESIAGHFTIRNRTAFSIRLMAAARADSG